MTTDATTTPAPALPASGRALVAMVLGIVGLLILPAILSTIAVALGAMAIRETARDPALRGRGQAIVGVVLGIVSLLVIVVPATATGEWGWHLVV